MSATTTAISKWDFRVTLRNDTLTVNSPSGNKTVTLSVPAARKAALTIKQASLLNHLCRQAGGSVSPVTVTLNRDECLTLAGIRDKVSPAAQTASRTNTVTEARQESRTIGNGLDRDEARIDQLRKVTETAQGGMSMLIYDIPDTKGKDCPNPSGLLWHYGFRLNLSCWVLPDKSLQAQPVRDLLSHWATHRIEVHLIPYHPDALAQIKAIAQAKLEEEVRRIHTSLINRLASASDRLEEAKKSLEAKATENGTTPRLREVRETEQHHDSDVRGIVRQAAESFAAALDCARAFDDYERLEDLFNGLRQAIKSEELSVNARLRRDGRKTLRLGL